MSSSHIVSALIVVGSWFVFGCLWRCLRSRPLSGGKSETAKYGRFPRWTFHAVLLATSVVVLTGFGGISVPAAPVRIANGVGALLVTGGLSFAFSARRHLGQYWSSGVAVAYEGRDLLRDGPYAFVRHPIYAGELFMALGTTIWSVNWACIVSLLLPLFYYNLVRARTEDKLLRNQSPESVAEYQNAVPMFFPRPSAIPKLSAWLFPCWSRGIWLVVRVIHIRAVILWSATTTALTLIFSHNDYPLWKLLVLVFVVANAHISIGAFNDLCDEDLDLRFKPQRPLPAKALQRSDVWIVVALSFLLSIVAATFLGMLALTGTLVMMALGATYSARLKRTPFSALPFVIGFLGQSYWLLALVGNMTMEHLLTPLYATPLVVGLHLANQLGDVQERETGVRGLIHCVGARYGFKVTCSLLLIAPFFLLRNVFQYRQNAGSFWVGCCLYYTVIALWSCLAPKDGLPDRGRHGLTFSLVSLGSMCLIGTWASTITWTLK